jgi:serine/threonine protein kinase
LDLDNIDDMFAGGDDSDDSEPKEKIHEFLPLPTDIWSMGVTIFTYFNGVCPFMGNTEYLTMKAVAEKEIPNIDDFSADLNDLISRMTNKDPKSRPNVQEVLDHPWFN